MRSLNTNVVALPGDLNARQLNRLRYASYVVPQARLVYVETPKAACSSFKHTIASISGFDCSKTIGSVLAAKTDSLAIHDRNLVDIESLPDLTEQQRKEILSSNQYLRFCIVRNPYTRLASAWSDRLLSHSLSPSAPILEQYPLPDYKADLNYLKYKFNEFIDCLYYSEYPRFTNHHWQSMEELLIPDVVKYNMVIRVEQMKQQLPQLINHVESKGIVWPGLPRINETVMQLGACLYTASSKYKVHKMYRQDFQRYGYEQELDFESCKAPILPDEEYIKAIQQRNQRLFSLSLKLRGLM